MTDFFYRIENYKPDHRTYGGTVSQYDFDAHITLKDAASKVVAAFKVDRQCMQNIISNNRCKNNRNLQNVDYKKFFPEGDEQDV